VEAGGNGRPALFGFHAARLSQWRCALYIFDPQVLAWIFLIG
jgi:hypothetical protein